MARFFLKEMPVEYSSPLEDLVKLYMRFATLQKRLVRIQAELDNVRELIRQKGL